MLFLDNFVYVCFRLSGVITRMYRVVGENNLVQDLVVEETLDEGEVRYHWMSNILDNNLLELVCYVFSQFLMLNDLFLNL